MAPLMLGWGRNEPSYTADCQSLFAPEEQRHR